MADCPDTAVAERTADTQPREELLNDFSLQVATVNGSGSQSSNMVLMRSLFQMGIPVSGKNLFPSNIAGLPTWFTIRANKNGWIAHKKEIDFLVAMNPETAHEDVMSLQSRRSVVYEESLKLSSLRSDLVFYPVPFGKLSAEVSPDAKLRKLLANMIYVGVVGHLLGIDPAEIRKAIGKQFRNKAKAAELNQKAVEIGMRYAADNLVKRDPCRVERMDKTAGKIIIDGNSAAALGAIFHGCTVVPWYPITPSTSLVETMIEYAKKYRLDPETGKATFAIVQAEDELAALGMVLGAGWAGARAMTATSGPGISLMSEFAGLAYFAEVPAVVWDVQRVGPSTGLPTRTSQGDVLSTYCLSHGDTKHIVLFPASVEECFSMAGEAFDLAEFLQTPIFVLSDLDLGMNNWMSDKFVYPEKPIIRGKVLSAEELEKIGMFERYRDVDGDGVAYRTLPGTKHPLAAYFTRGSGHNEKAQYSEKPEDFKNLMDRLARKFETARQRVPAPLVSGPENADIGIIAYGTTDWAVQESLYQLEHEKGMKCRYLRIKAIPLNETVREFVRCFDRVYVVEQNRDAQMAELIRLETGADNRRVRSVLHYDGIPIDARSIAEGILSQERGT